jgi:hypothetical protein
MAIEILSTGESELWRQGYIDAFVDTSKEYYVQRIAKQQQFSDGMHNSGYLWDCLRVSSRITVQRFENEICLQSEVLVMADDHSRDQIPGAPLWPYAPHSVARLSPQELLEIRASLPEDIYVFDNSLNWTLVLTHEHDNRRRLCLAVGITA